jgi:hypothetical protein
MYIQHQQDFLQICAHYLHAKWKDFLMMINSGQDSNITVAELKSLINP